MINQITIQGNLGNDPEIKFTNDEAVTTFSLAHTPRSKKNGVWTDGETMWFRVSLWNFRAEAAVDSLKKGDRVLVIGKFNYAQYTDKEGNPKSSLEITAQEFALMPRVPKAAEEKPNW